jgi:pyruvate/2-oxoacid:ferredoxin oxidoreductase alpha subunit
LKVKVLMGNTAVAEAVRMADVDVVSAYPITP